MDPNYGGPPYQQPVSDGMKWGIAILSAFVPLVGIIMGIIYLNDANPSKKAAGKLWLIVGIVFAAVSCICAVLVQLGSFAAAAGGTY